MKTFFSLWKVGAIAGLLSGLSHVTLQAFGHISLLPHFLFFLVFGGLQIFWSVLFFIKHKRSDLFYYSGIALHGGFLGMWALTRLLNAPFIGSPESVGFIGLAVALCELIALIAIVASQTKSAIVKEFTATAIIMMLITFGVSSSLYTSGMVGETLFPFLKMEGGHGGGAHGH